MRDVATSEPAPASRTPCPEDHRGVALGFHDLDGFLDKAEAFVLERRAEWDLCAEADVDMEVVNHVMRVWIQEGSIGTRTPMLRALVARQHADGGWGDTRDELRSKVRSTAFATQMLMRSLRSVDVAELRDAIRRGVGFLLATQRPDGSWDDDRWHYLDATSVAVGTLLFVAREPWATIVEKTALDRGMAFVAAVQRSDGLWSHKARSSPIEITAHFLQKVIPYGGDEGRITKALEQLLRRRHPDGHWDHESVDSTCDATRALMLGGRSPAGKPIAEEIRAGVSTAMAWLLGAAAQGSIGARPGKPPKLLDTTDVIDTVYKYRQFREGSIIENYR